MRVVDLETGLLTMSLKADFAGRQFLFIVSVYALGKGCHLFYW